MRVGLIAEKIGMSRFYDKHRVNHSVTILKVTNCKVVGIKTNEDSGYNAVNLSHGNQSKLVSKPFKGFLKKNNLNPFSRSMEFRVSEVANYKIGDNLDVSNFIAGQYIDVSSNSKGKGFAGGMKRHNFSGNRASHGVSISHRSHGSTGQCQDPGKVFKGKKMAGRLGNKKVTIQNLQILKVDVDNNLLVVKGAVPGHKGSIISIVDATKKKQDLKTISSNDGLPVEKSTPDLANSGENTKKEAIDKNEEKISSPITPNVKVQEDKEKKMTSEQKKNEDKQVNKE